ncbi:MAG: hypothetical protein KA341_01895 [Saprospiraceae bacterium]|nr:hypothetical protein [Saprospiraceae bacterium]
MKSVQITIVTMLTLLFLLPTGCRKDDSVSQLEQADEQLMRDFLSDDYFATASKYYNPPPADHTAGIATETRTKESMTTALKDYFAANPEQVKTVNKKYGYPVWEHAVHMKEEDGEGDICHLPLSGTKSNKAEAIVYAYRKSANSNLFFQLLDRKDIRKLMKKKDMKKNSSKKYNDISIGYAAANLAYFDQQIFSTIDCDLVNILKNESNITSDKNTTESRTCYTFVTITTTYWQVTSGPANGPVAHTYYDTTASYQFGWYCINTYVVPPTPPLPPPPTNTGGTGSVGTAIDQTLKTNFPDANTDCLLKLNADIKDLLANAKDPCSQSNLINAVTNIINTSCSTINTYTYLDQSVKTFMLNQQVNDGLKGVDYVGDSELNAINTPCDKINCIWKQIKNKTWNINQNSYSCVMDIMDEDLNGPMRVEIGYAPNSLGIVNAQTVPHSTYGGQTQLFNTRININPDLCNALNNGTKDPMEAVGMFLHEMVHARLYEHLYHNGFIVNSQKLFNDVWKDFVQSKYPGITIGQTQHQLMAQEYISDLAFALYQLNGNIGSPDDYLIFAWQGLDEAFDSTQKATFTFIPTTSQFATMRNRYYTNVQSKMSSNPNAINFNCR